jgi:hypothetical protein
MKKYAEEKLIQKQSKLFYFNCSSNKVNMIYNIILKTLLWYGMIVCYDYILVRTHPVNLINN